MISPVVKYIYNIYIYIGFGRKMRMARRYYVRNRISLISVWDVPVCVFVFVRVCHIVPCRVYPTTRSDFVNVRYRAECVCDGDDSNRYKVSMSQKPVQTHKQNDMGGRQHKTKSDNKNRRNTKEEWAKRRERIYLLYREQDRINLELKCFPCSRSVCLYLYVCVFVCDLNSAPDSN